MKIEKVREITLPTGLLDLAATEDGSQLYGACVDGQVYAVEKASGKATPFAGTHGSFASGCVLLQGGRTLVSSGYDGYLIWHDVESRAEIRRVRAHDYWSWQLAASPDGSRIASVTGQYLAGGEKYEPATGVEPTVKIFDAETGALLHAFAHLPPVLSVSFSRDGQHLAAANMMGDVCVWEVASGQVAAQFSTAAFTSWGIIKSPHFCGGIYSLDFAPDGQSLLCCGMGPMTDPMAGNGKMLWQRWAWREATPRMTQQIADGEGGSGLMESLVYHPDGSSFLMAGRQAQGTWNVALFSAEGKLLASLDTKTRITAAQFAEGGKVIYLSSTLSQKRETNGTWQPSGRIMVVPVTA